jgi:hypothetical protein
MNVDLMKEQLARLGTLTLFLKARPSAPKNQIKGLLSDGTLKIDIAAAPEDGKANDALMRFLAEEFGVPIGNIELLSGPASRKKLVKIQR